MDRLQQTICALATPPGTGGIAVVRVSGPDAYPMVEKIFVPLHVGRKVAEAKGYTAMLGHYLLHGQEMDETIALFFRAPHSIPARMSSSFRFTVVPLWRTACWKPLSPRAQPRQGRVSSPAARWSMAACR